VARRPCLISAVLRNRDPPRAKLNSSSALGAPALDRDGPNALPDFVGDVAGPNVRSAAALFSNSQNSSKHAPDRSAGRSQIPSCIADIFALVESRRRPSVLSRILKKDGLRPRLSGCCSADACFKSSNRGLVACRGESSPLSISPTSKIIRNKTARLVPCLARLLHFPTVSDRQ